MRIILIALIALTAMSANASAESRRLPAPLSNHTAIVLLIDPKDGSIVDTNKAAVDFYGYTAQRLREMKIQEINILPPEDVEKEIVLAKNQKRNYFIFPHRLSNGSIKPVEVYSSPYSDNTNETLLISIIHDVEDKALAEKELMEYKGRLEELVEKQVNSILEANIREKWLVIFGGGILFVLFLVAVRKHLQTKLFQHKFEVERKCRELSARFEFLVQNAHDMILLVNNDGRIVEANTGALQGYGYPREEMLAMNMRDLREHEEGGNFSRIRESIHSGQGCMYEELHVRKDGSVFPVEASSNKFAIADGIYFQHIVRDISLRRQAEQERKEIIRLLHKSNADKDMLFSIIAHDLKSPMASIIALTDLLKDNVHALSAAELHHVCIEMNKNMKNVMLLLDDLLQWARMNQGGIDFSPSLYSLANVVRDSVQPLRGIAENKNITISEAIPEDIRVYIDLPMVNTVLRNIVANAIKFTHADGTISIDTELGNGAAQVRISDDGIGIARKLLDSIFEHGSEKRRPGTAGEKGSGLGLILCREFIEKHGGDIWIESEKDMGTSVYFTLPTGEAYMA